MVLLSVVVSITLHVHHVVINVTAAVDSWLLRCSCLVLMFPAAGSGDWKVVDCALVLTCCKHVSHASLVCIKATQLRYLALVCLTLVEL